MAIAGKVAITLSTENGGAWSANVTYDRLVAVKHNNNLYISRKTVTNVEPPNNEFWFLALEGFSGDDIEDIIDGTTPVGNALALDGHAAEYFAKGTDLANYLPLTGGKISKASGSPLQIENTVTDVCTIDMFGANNHIGSLGFYGANTPVMVNTTGEVINLLHTGNKPVGTYTGNGSATSRTIKTGGLGFAILVFRAGSGAILTPMGGILLNEAGNTSTIKASEARFYNGDIIESTTHSFLNESGVTYTYQVL